MAALTAARDTRQDGVGDGKAVVSEIGLKQLANVKIYPGALVVIQSGVGYAKPAVTGTGLIACGVADPDPLLPVSDSTGLNSGDLVVRVLQGVFAFNNSTSGDLIAQADVGKKCFIVDDNTVAKTSASATRSVAGVIVGINSIDGVYVAVAMQIQDLTTT